MNKKGQDSFNILNWIVGRVPFIIGVLIIFYVFYTSMYSYALKTHDIGNQIFEKRFLYSKEGLAYEDSSIGRVYPGIIDESKFTDDNINKSFIATKNYVAAKLILTDIRTSTRKEVYLNQKWFDRWSPYTSFDQFDMYKLRRFVMVYDGSTIRNAMLEMQIVVNNPEAEVTRG